MLLALLACSTPEPTSFACGKLICDPDQICLHWEISDSAPPDAGHGCVEAPEDCDGVPSCDCAADVCTSDCSSSDGGVSCSGDEPTQARSDVPEATSISGSGA